MHIRTAKADELEEVLSLMRVAFPDEDVDGLVEELVAGPSFIEEFSLVAKERGRTIGHALFTRAYIDSESGSVPVLCLAPLAVLPERQNAGVGAALVEAGLALARERSERMVVVVGHPEYYPRFGFRPALPLGILPPHVVDPAEAWMVVELTPGSLEGVRGDTRFEGPLADERWWRE